MGRIVGFVLGRLVGYIVGALVGKRDGTSVGFRVSPKTVGFIVSGYSVGCTVDGFEDGLALGQVVGLAEGSIDGVDEEGVVVGDCVVATSKQASPKLDTDSVIWRY